MIGLFLTLSGKFVLTKKNKIGCRSILKLNILVKEVKKH